ncbi:MAG TPA: hypothetical protein DGN59_11575 [Candidatus Latescibacteria bacterium]|nr:hypothetical protein [Candidatus Latescibacterota bacterium]
MVGLTPVNWLFWDGAQELPDQTVSLEKNTISGLYIVLTGGFGEVHCPRKRSECLLWRWIGGAIRSHEGTAIPQGEPNAVAATPWIQQPESGHWKT